MVVLSGEDVLNVVSLNSGENGNGVSQRKNPRRDLFRFFEDFFPEVVVPAEALDPALAGEAVELELAERECLDVLDQIALVVGRDDRRLILESLRVFGCFGEEIEL